MFNQWIERIAGAKSSSTEKSVADIERVSAALLVEVARADHQLEDVEIQSIINASQKSSSLSHQEISSIVMAAVVDADHVVSFHEHVHAVNEYFSRDQKLALIEQMWRVAVADGDIDRYEEYAIRKLCDLIYVRHSEFIKAKLRVIEGT